MSRPGGSKYKFLESPKTKVYDQNYNVGMNFYQPMVDYLDDKAMGRSVKLPHLPWTDERGLDTYPTTSLMRSYSIGDLSPASKKTRDRIHAFKLRPQLQLSAETDAEKIESEVKSSTVGQMKILQQIKAIQKKMYTDDTHRPEKDAFIQKAYETHKNYLRGKSAKAIENHLLYDEKDYEEEDTVDIKKIQRSQIINAHSTVGHCKLMSERMTKEVEDSFMKPLGELSKDLASFDQKTTHYFYDKRLVGLFWQRHPRLAVRAPMGRP